MRDQDKTKEQLTAEIQKLRKKVAQLEKEESKHKKLEKKLKESEEKYRDLAENTADILVRMDLKGNITYMSKSVEKETGYTREEIEGQNIRELLLPDYLQKAMIRIKKWKEGEKKLPPYEVEVKTEDGRIIPFELNTSPVYEGNEIKAIDIVARNITERKKTEKALQEKEKQLRTLIDTIPDCVYFKDEKGKNIVINKAYQKLLGKEREEVLGKTDKQLLPPNLAEQCAKSDREVLSQRKTVHSQESMVNEEGEKVYIESTKSPFLDEGGNIKGIVGVSRDITQRIKAEKALKDNEEIMRSIFDGLPVGIYRTTPGGEYLNCNLALMKMLKFPDRETMMKTNVWETYVNPKDRKRWQKRMEKEGSVMGFESRWRCYDGEIIWVRESACTVRGDGEKVLFYEGAVEDITEKKRIERSLQKQRAYFDQLFENAQEAIAVTDKKGVIFRVNQEFTNLFGFSQEEVRDKSIDDLLVTPEYYKEAVSITKKVAQGERGDFETKRRHKNGYLIDVSLMVSPIKVGGKKVAYYAIYRDITERKKAEDKIKASLKEKEVMLREIHHRVKNNLQIIISLLRLQSTYVKDKKDAEIFKQSQERIRSMALIHEKLYQSQDLAHIDLSQYIKNFAVHLFHAYGINPDLIRIHTQMENIKVDVNSAIPLGLIINELLSNSLKHAFPEGQTGDVYIKLHSVKEGLRRLEVEDNGVGLSPNVDIQNPQSLGLQLVTNLVKQLKGTIELNLQKGTKFILEF